MNLLVFDIVSSPSEPAITVQASSDGVTYQEARSVSRNGYRVNSWLPAMEVRFIRIVITPSHPDDLGGTTFSFGITGFSGRLGPPLSAHPKTPPRRREAAPLSAASKLPRAKPKDKPRPRLRPMRGSRIPVQGGLFEALEIT